MRPDFIPRDLFRAYLGRGELNKYAKIGGVMAASYVARCEREGRPIPHKTRFGSPRWRLLDIVARARADSLSIDPPYRKELERDIASLEAEKAALSADIATLKHQLSLKAASSRLTGATLLTEEEIAAGRMELPCASGVYFLLSGERVVYVGQSVAVFKRVLEHMATKRFDGFAYVPCDPENLNVLESLYIHALRPILNGKSAGGRVGMCAPMRLDQLLLNGGKHDRAMVEVETLRAAIKQMRAA